MTKLLLAAVMVASIIVAICLIMETFEYRRRAKPLEERIKEQRRRLYGKKEGGK